jgi:cell division protein FtsB
VTRPEAPARIDTFRPVLGATVLLVFALLAIAALKSYRDLAAARAHEHQLETRIAETRARSEKLRLRIDRLRHDPGMLERLAREDLGMVHPRDVIVELPEEGTGTNTDEHERAGTGKDHSAGSPSPGVGVNALPAVTPEAGWVGPPAPPPAAVPVSGPSGPPGRG